MGKKEDFDYAMNVTRIVMAPQSTIETFGTTTVNYMLISELMDQVNTVRVREGKMYSERPQIITPLRNTWSGSANTAATYRR